MQMKLYPFQEKVLNDTVSQNKVAYYLDMGTGKTYVGAEKLILLRAKVNLVVCQKSKIEDWVEHFRDNYEIQHNMMIYDCTKWNKSDWLLFSNDVAFKKDAHQQDVTVLVINYDLIWRRPDLLKLKDFTLLLDESSLIQNDSAKRSKYILKMSPANVILLSGTPTGGKYERLWSQLHLLGWHIGKKIYWNTFVNVEYLDLYDGRSIPVVKGYKNVDRLKRKMADYGCQFLKTDEVFDLPCQTFTKIRVNPSREYRIFCKKKIVIADDNELVGDTTLTRLLYKRQLCGMFSDTKLKAFDDLLESTDDRLIVFYNFNVELERLKALAEAHDKPVSIINGSVKDLEAYETKSDSVTFCQYQAASMGLNLQKANKLIYFTLPLSSELYEQSKKRVHRIGQDRPCFYYLLLVNGSVEEKILKALELRQDYTEELFKKDEA